MSQAFDTERVPNELFRVGFSPDVWNWVDWAFAGADGTFGNRWDDPQKNYRVLYTSSERFGAFLEVLAGYRPDLALLAELSEIEGEDDEPSALPPGRLPSNWRAERIVSRGVSDGVRGDLVAVGRAHSLATLRREMAGVALKCGLSDVNGDAIRRAAPRGFTQDVSRFIYECVRDDGKQYAGIFYLSQYADDVHNCAIFEREGPFPVTNIERSDIALDDEDFVRACALLEIQPA